MCPMEPAIEHKPHPYIKVLELATKFLFMHVNRIHSIDARPHHWLASVGNTKGKFDAKVLARFNNRDVGILLLNCNGRVLVVKSEVCLSLMKNGAMKTMTLFKAYVFAKHWA